MPDALTTFDALCTNIAKPATAQERQAHVDAFLVQHPQSPLIGQDSAIIFYTGAARQVILRGDMLQERSEPLTRLADTTLWFHRGWYEPDARLDYHLLVDGRDVGDPRNPRVAPSGYGPRAELRMPEWRGFELDPWPDDRQHPRVTAYRQFHSRLYPSTRTVWVYTPPAYSEQQRYPSIYFHDGGDYLAFAGAASILDRLIATHAMPPCVAVFVDPSTEHTRIVDYDLNGDYSRFICDELARWIDQRYATEPDPAQRATIGASFGGLIALMIALQRPDRFGLVGSQSGFVGRRGNALINAYLGAGTLPLRIHLLVGSYETAIGGTARIDPDEANFVQGNRRLRNVLTARNSRFAYAEYHDGHAWSLWRTRLPEMLIWLLGNEPRP